MIKIVLVDDETVSLQAMGRFIARLRSDVEVVGMFESMAETLAYLAQHEVDMVFTDIRMPGGSGIDLARHIQARYPDIKIVFISAYRDFEYAQQAISLNVKHYLSKPIDIGELSDILDKLVSMIVKERQRKLSEKDRFLRYDNLLLWAKTDMYTDILSGLLTDEQKIRRCAENVELTEAQMHCCHGVVTMRCEKITDFPKGWGEYYHLVSNLMREFKSIEDYVTIIKRENEVTMAVRFRPEFGVESARARLSHDSETVRRLCADTLSVRLIFEPMYICSSLFELNHYQNTVNSMQLFRKKFQELSSAVFSGNSEKVEEIFCSIDSYTCGLEPDQARYMFSEMLDNLQKSFELSGAESDELFNAEELQSCTGISEMSATARGMLSRIQEFQRLSALGLEMLTIQKAKEFVQANYMHDIMLEDIANHVNLSSFYFSKFFKAKTGSNVTDYITSVRMEAATTLFQGGQYKIYEISEMCGYKSRKYFSHAFKQYTGYTPTEYQRMLNLQTGGGHDGDA